MFHTTLYPSCILLHAVLTLASPTPHKSTLNTSHQSFPERRGNSDSGVEWDNLTKALDYFGGRHESAAGGEGSTVSQRDSLDLATSSETDVKHKRRDEPPRTYTQKLKVLPALDIIPDGIYYAEVDIKGQDKPFSMIMDTGSSAFSVPGIKCGNQQGCQGDTKYSNSGIDQQKAVTTSYGAIKVEGDYFTDDVSMNNAVAEKMDIISISKAENMLSAEGNTLGVLGLAFAGQRMNGGEVTKSTYMQTLIAQNKLDRPVFSIYLGRTASQTQDQSAIVLGGVSERLYHGSTVITPVVGTQKVWEITLQAATVNHVSAGSHTKGTAIVDSGSAWTYLSHRGAAAIFAKVNKAFPVVIANNPSSDKIFYVMPCDVDPEIAFVFENYEFKMDPLDIKMAEIRSDGTILNTRGGPGGKFVDIPSNVKSGVKPLAGIDKDAGTKYCLTTMISADPPSPGQAKPFVLGQNFLKSWYSVFTIDPKGSTVGFAAATGNNPNAPKKISGEDTFPGFPKLPGAGNSPVPLKKPSQVWQQDPDFDLTTDETLDGLTDEPMGSGDTTEESSDETMGVPDLMANEPSLETF